MPSKSSIFAILPLLATAFASPTPAKDIPAVKIVARASSTAAIPSRITSPAQLESVIDGLKGDASELALGASVVLDLLSAIVPAPTPASIAAELSSVASVYKAHPTDFLRSSLELVANGLAPRDVIDVILSQSPLENSSNNVNLAVANPPIYPKAQAGDAKYNSTEKALKGAIYIPLAFTYGKVPPLILVPGTGAEAGTNFGANVGKLFAGSSYADPVYLNIPGAQFDDMQINSEYVAYAINYISSISGHKNVSVLTWSAGSLNSQWALQYWPSTRSKVTDLIQLSGDLHGTVLAYLLGPSFPPVPLPPSIYQQEYSSRFVATLRNGGGSSAYVPTTTVYTIFDEIVQPQEGDKASAFILDARRVGVSNTEIQAACTLLQPAGTIYPHEGTLFNPLAIALAIDALTHPGPANISRIDLPKECQKIAANGLSLTDVLVTEAITPAAFIGGLAYVGAGKGVTQEPPIAAYAQKDTPK